MKKNLLIGIIGFGAFAMFLTGVKAETINLDGLSETGQSVTVGEVDVPVYSVDITWGDMTFDYKYNDVTGNYYWREQKTCHRLEEGAWEEYRYENEMLDIYWDDSCETELAYGEYDFKGAVAIAAYYAEENGAKIEIVDNSKNSEIIPSIYWTSEDNYDYVDGKFYYQSVGSKSCTVVSSEDRMNSLLEENVQLYTDSSCKAESSDSLHSFEENKYYFVEWGSSHVKELLTNEIPEDGRGFEPQGIYSIKLSLINDETKEIKQPTAGDKIGTVTISIEAR